jgi:hypothetical protein
VSLSDDGKKKKRGTPDGKNQYFPFIHAHHSSFSLLTIPDRLRVAIFTPGKIILTVEFCGNEGVGWRIP